MTAKVFAPRWLATGGAVVLAGVIGVALLLQQNSPACAAPPGAGAHQGKATFYDLAGGVGSCNFTPPADDLYVALGRTEYSGAQSCGSYLDVTGPRGKVRVKVFDTCPECGVGHLDLSRTAFTKIADPVAGIVGISYRAVPNAATPGPLSVTFVKGSSQYWWAVTLDNHANPVTKVQAKGPGGGWQTATHADYNYWIIERGAGNGPFSIRMTDLYGHTATATGVKLRPGLRQATTVRLTSGSAVGGVRGGSTPARKKTTGTSSPSPAAAKKKPSSPNLTASSSPAAPPTESAQTAQTAVEPPVALAAAPAAAHCGG